MTTTTTGRYCRVRALLLSIGLLVLWSAHTLGAGGTLTIIPHADLKNTDPIWTTAYITRNQGHMIYDTLFSLDDKFQPQPRMVDTWNVSTDGLKYTFTLRSGLKWHDGAPVRAADCVASIKRWGKRDGAETHGSRGVSRRGRQPHLDPDAQRTIRVSAPVAQQVEW
jgi:peptide/nickel transport system substrate-binding protein